MKIILSVTDTELAFIDDLLKPDPVALVVKVGHVIFTLFQKLRHPFYFSNNPIEP